MFVELSLDCAFDAVPCTVPMQFCETPGRRFRHVPKKNEAGPCTVDAIVIYLIWLDYMNGTEEHMRALIVCAVACLLLAGCACQEEVGEPREIVVRVVLDDSVQEELARARRRIDRLENLLECVCDDMIEHRDVIMAWQEEMAGQ